MPRRVRGRERRGVGRLVSAVGPWLVAAVVFASPLVVLPVAVLAYEAVGAVVVAGGWLVVRLRPRPAYDWPVWAYRAGLGVGARVQRKRELLMMAKTSSAAQTITVTAIRAR